MSTPSFSNIDLWLFELAEGNLSKDQIEQLELFIMQHPELDIERDMWEVAKVDPTPVAFPNVEVLQKKRRGAGIYTSSAAVMASLFVGFFAYSYVTTGSMFSFFSDKESLHVASTEAQERDILARISELTDGFVSNGLAMESGRFGNAMPNDEMPPYTVSLIQNELESTLTVEDGETPSESANASTFTADLEEVNPTLRPVIASRLDQRLTNQPIVPITSNLWQNDALNGFELDRKENEGVFVQEPRTLDPYLKETKSSVRSSFAATKSGTSTSVKRSSFKTKLNRFARSIQRMMDNPVALKNSRDPHYHVPGMTSNDINFSAAGTLLATRVQTLSRAQWLGKENEQFKNQLSVDGYSYGMRGGWGIQLDHTMYRDGGIHIGQLALTYSPKISITNSVSFEPSVRFKMGDKHLVASQMNGIDMVEVERGNAINYYEDGQTPIGRNLWYKDLGAGALVNTKWFFVGARVDNIFRHTDNIYGYDIQHPRRAASGFVASAGTDWLNQRKTLGLSPYLVYQKNDQLSELWGGANVRWHWAIAGLAVNDKLDPAASIGVKSKTFSINYNIDYTTSAMTGERALSHQVSLRFVTKQNRFGQR